MPILKCTVCFHTVCPLQTEQRSYLTKCQHLLCFECTKNSHPLCAKCKNPTQFMQLHRQIPKKYRLKFMRLSSALNARNNQRKFIEDQGRVNIMQMHKKLQIFKDFHHKIRLNVHPINMEIAKTIKKIEKLKIISKIGKMRRLVFFDILINCSVLCKKKYGFGFGFYVVCTFFIVLTSLLHSFVNIFISQHNVDHCTHKHQLASTCVKSKIFFFQSSKRS